MAKIKNKKVNNKLVTKKQIIIKLYKDKFINEMVLWNLLGLKFKKSKLKEIDKTFRKYHKKTI